MRRFGKILPCLLVAPSPALAHAAEQGFVLLLPTDVYGAAGTATVAASMLLMAAVPGRLAVALFRPLKTPLAPAGPVTASSLAATAVFLTLVAIGLLGPTDPQINLMPLTLWTVWWMGLLVVQGVAFDVWRWVEPWSGLTRLLSIPPPLRLPAWLGAWPAVAGLITFQAFVLIDIAPNDPARLATVALSYWAVTLAGMLVFGPDWLARAEFVTVTFRLIGRLRAWHRPGLGLPGWAALEAPPDRARAVLCLTILATGSFDGLSETFWWLGRLGINPLEFPGRSAVALPNLVGLVAAIILLIALFAAAVWVGCALSARLGAPVPVGRAFDAFAVTILPIGLGYHFAHYVVTFLVQGQYVLAALADPFAHGWSLPPFDAVRIRTGFLATPGPVRTIWLIQAGAVVASHVLAVLMAHRVAARLARGHRAVVALQLGLAVLMIGYTIFGLWLLASPRGA
ncbi:hypothetical protein [Jannaschia seohaensis]|uniref:Fenitrothion hydrolase n=1 Tax=Jannaschia seohaensis TaxID=475081 RepID=A0A2Y9AAR8_9RHOB|nr:hypothetical protein [Jannaschia seohaensis]PWJ21274.1 hypothetical protein BCF38_102524 [Jannaschia seohaensis]SSA41684.1 hypothetical protein SAMN05421539_102524 [Jannaschia seohaensis]